MSQSALNDTSNSNELLMKRFNGDEKYKIKTATWNLYKDNGLMNLCFLVESEEAIAQSEDTASFFQLLNWELNLVGKTIEENHLKGGFAAKIPEAYNEELDGWLTNFYFAEHEGSENNCIEILDRRYDELLIRITGEINDVNYYDGSKPRSKVVVQAWFKKNENTLKSVY